MLNPLTLNPDEVTYEEDDEFELLPDGQKKTYYLYELKKLVKGNSEALLTFSPNSVNLVIIDKDEYLKIDAVRPDAQTYEYRTKQSVSNIDGEVDISQYEKENIYSTFDINGSLNFSNGRVFKYSRNKLYMLSEFLLETDEDIVNFGFLIQKLDVNSILTENMNGTKSIEIVDLNTWTAKDSNNAIFRIGKQLDELSITGIKLTTPSSFLLGALNVLGENEEGMLIYPDVKAKTDMIPLYINPIEITDSGFVNVLNFWMSDNILSIEKAINFIDERPINYLFPDDSTPPKPDQVIFDIETLDYVEIVANGTYPDPYVYQRGYPYNDYIVNYHDPKVFNDNKIIIPGKIPNISNLPQISTIDKITRLAVYTKTKVQNTPIYSLLVDRVLDM